MHRHAAQSIGDISSSIFRASGSRKHISNSALRQQKSSSALRKPRPLPSQHYDSLHKLTNEIVDRNAGPNSKRWHKTPSLRGEEKMLTASIQKPATPRLLSAEQMQFASDVNFEEMFNEFAAVSPDLVLTPGTFVEIRR
jgi:hypothetical protein